MNLLFLRFVLSVMALLAICLFAAGVLFKGGDLTQTQVVLLTLLASALIAEAKSSSGWVFDGVAPKDDPVDPGTVTTSTTETTTKAPQTSAPGAPTNPPTT